MEHQATTFLGMDARLWSFVVALLVLNVFVFWVLRRLSLVIELREILAVKDPIEVAARAQAVTAALQVRANANTPPTTPPPANEPEPIPDPIPKSYSRTSGFLGSIVMVGALWGFANYAVWAAFWSTDTLKEDLEGFGSFFLAGSALFAPYAFNQLGTVFRGRP